MNVFVDPAELPFIRQTVDAGDPTQVEGKAGLGSFGVEENPREYG
jgi:hypothetical protein